MAALAAGLLLASAPAFAGGDHKKHSAADTTQGQNASGVNGNEAAATRTARNQNQTDRQTQNEKAGEATPASPDAGLTPQTDNGRANGPNAPAQSY
jgi:hypothetical protein